MGNRIRQQTGNIIQFGVTWLQGPIELRLILLGLERNEKYLETNKGTQESIRTFLVDNQYVQWRLWCNYQAMFAFPSR